MKEREKLGSRLGFILISAGCAIGIGNVWTGRWRCIRTVLSDLPGYPGTACYDHGIFGWTCQPEKPGQSLLRSGETRPEMAHPRIYHSDRMLSSDDVLHNRYRLDAELLLYDSNRQIPGA